MHDTNQTEPARKLAVLSIATMQDRCLSPWRRELYNTETR